MTHTFSQAMPAENAFERVAARYDDLFTRSVIGRAQRSAVWAALSKTFSAGQRILELNCGTGEDALFLASRGISVVASDASPAMIAVAERRKSVDAPASDVQFRVLSNENLSAIESLVPFDGAFSNFSGLNCTQDIAAFGVKLTTLVRPGARLLVCLFSRVCLWEILWYLSHGNAREALRRLPGTAVAHVQGAPVRVWYPRFRAVVRALAPGFRLRSIQAIGLFVPPSYVESWASKHRRVIAALQNLDRLCSMLPILRTCGDHVLLDFERRYA